MTKLKITILLSLFFILANIRAQQFPVYTQYLFNDYLMNPAVAGTIDQTPIKLSYRNQWIGFTDMQGNSVAPKTVAFSAHTPLSDQMGVGGYVYNDVTGPISHSVAQFSYSWRTTLSPPECFWERKKFMSLAYGTRLLQFSYDDTQTTSWTEYFGNPNGADPILPNVVETDFLVSHSVGAYFYTEYVYAGFAAQNLYARPLKILARLDKGYENMLTPEYNCMAAAYIPVSADKSLAIEPSFLTKTTSWSETQIDLGFRFIYLNSIYAGMVYRSAETATGFLLGFETGDMFFGYSYDTAVEGINGYSSGTHELAIGVNLGILSNFKNVRLKSRFKNRRMLLNPFRKKETENRRGSGA